MSDKGSPTDTTKREFMKKATYVIPTVLTLAAAPSFASAGSSSGKKKGRYGNYKIRGYAHRGRGHEDD